MRRRLLSKDVAELAAREEIWLLFKAAKNIYKLPEALWDEKIQLFPFHQRQKLREQLDIIKEHRQAERYPKARGR